MHYLIMHIFMEQRRVLAFKREKLVISAGTGVYGKSTFSHVTLTKALILGYQRTLDGKINLLPSSPVLIKPQTCSSALFAF